MIYDLDGWGKIDNSVMNRENEAKGKEIATQFRLAFHDNEAGRFVLKHLIDVFIKRRIVRERDDMFSAGIRQGQADVVIGILNEIDYAMKGTK